MPYLGAIAARLGIKGGIIVALLVALGIMWWRADTISGQRDSAIQLAANERAAHAITRASVDRLQKASEDFVAAGKERARAAQEALQEQRERSSALDSQIARIRAERAAAGPVVVSERCETPAAVMEAEGI